MSGILVPVPTNFYASQADANRLLQLRSKEDQDMNERRIRDAMIAPPPRQFIFTAQDDNEKIRIIRKLHNRIFIVVDQDGYPERVDMPGNQYGKETGVVHILDAAEWSNLSIIPSLQVQRWPTTAPEHLLTAPRNSEEQCVGCLLKDIRYQDDMIHTYASQVRLGDTINYETQNDGVIMGDVEDNNQIIHKIKFKLFNSDRTVIVPWKWLTVKPTWRDQYLIRDPPAEHKNPCDCDVAR
jgi:hypothetical protein